jgi:S1-C subfamily serine protease
MKKLLILAVFILIVTGLSSCVRQVTYDDLLMQYQQDVYARNDIYEDYIKTYNDLNQHVIPAIVKVNRTIPLSQTTSTGSGFIFHEDDDNYYVITNYHVIESNGFYATITVYDYLSQAYQAELIVADPAYDLAILSFPKEDDVLHVLVFDEDMLNYSDPVYVIGYPNGQIHGITIGKLVDIDQVDLESGGISAIDFEIYIIDAPVETGSSGSVVINEAYEIVGVIFAGNFRENQDTSTFAFVVPTEKVFEFFELYEFLLEDEVTS